MAYRKALTLHDKLCDAIDRDETDWATELKTSLVDLAQLKAFYGTDRGADAMRDRVGPKTVCNRLLQCFSRKQIALLHKT